MSTWDDALAELEPIFQSYCAQANLPGCAYGIVQGGQLVHTGGIGAVNPGVASTPGPDTIYRIASMTKSFAALAVLMLRDAGKLRLDDRAADYLPALRDLAYPTRDSAPITVRHLLTMAAGWPEDNPWGDRQLARTDAELDAMLRQGVSFANAPGVDYEYSNYGYMVLGRIITEVSGQPSPAFITDHILRPLGMTDTGRDAEAMAQDRLARGWRWQDEPALAGAWLEEPMLPTGGDAAAFGGLFTTVRDLSRWVALFLAAFPPRDDADDGLVQRATLREMQQAYSRYAPATVPPRLGEPVQWTSGGYGFGLTVKGTVSLTCRQTGDVVIVGHAGGLPGFGSHMCWAPAYDLGVIALGNVTYAPMRPAATDALWHLLRQGQPPRRAVQPAPALETARAGLNRLLATWDDALADDLSARLFAENFFLDEPRDRWQAQLATLRARHGRFTPDGPLRPENALRGTWRMAGEQGWCDVFLTLTPTTPPLVQAVEIDSVLPPGPELARLLDELVALIARPSRRGVDHLFARTADRDALDRQVRMVNLLCGPCTLGEVLAGDGTAYVQLKLAGPRGMVEAEVWRDEGEDRLEKVEFRLVEGKEERA